MMSKICRQKEFGTWNKIGLKKRKHVEILRGNAPNANSLDSFFQQIEVQNLSMMYLFCATQITTHEGGWVPNTCTSLIRNAQTMCLVNINNEIKHKPLLYCIQLYIASSKLVVYFGQDCFNPCMDGEVGMSVALISTFLYSPLYKKSSSNSNCTNHFK